MVNRLLRWTAALLSLAFLGGTVAAQQAAPTRRRAPSVHPAQVAPNSGPQRTGSSADADKAGSSLPGGASSLQETYQDWGLSCRSTTLKTICVVSQQQTQQNGQRLLAIELRRGIDDGISGNLILPFGLLLDAGAILQIDEEQPGTPLRFSTCLPAGCLVPLSFDAKTLTTLRAGTALKIKVEDIGKKELTLSVSLKGLAAALDRLRVLTGA